MRRIVVNVLLACTIIPLMLLIRDYISIEITKTPIIYSGTFAEYERLHWPFLLLTVLLFLVFVLLPYNIVLVNRYRKNVSPPTLPAKVLWFTIILIIVWCMLGTFMNVWLYPYHKNLIVLLYMLGISLLFAPLIHFFADRYEMPRLATRV